MQDRASLQIIDPRLQRLQILRVDVRVPNLLNLTEPNPYLCRPGLLNLEMVHYRALLRNLPFKHSLLELSVPMNRLLITTHIQPLNVIITHERIIHSLLILNVFPLWSLNTLFFDVVPRKGPFALVRTDRVDELRFVVHTAHY